MLKVIEKLQQKAVEMLESGEVDVVLGYTKGTEPYQ